MFKEFELKWAAKRALARNPHVYALLKRAHDRLTGTLEGEIQGILRASRRLSATAPSRGRILFFAPRWWKVHAAWELVMAYALRAEGYRPEFVICGGAAESCDSYEAEIKAGALCKHCAGTFESFLRTAGLPYRRLADFVNLDGVRADARATVASLSLEGCRAFEQDGVPVGRLIEPTVARSLRQCTFAPDERTTSLYRRYLETALINVPAIERILEEPWEAVVVLNGKFLAESLLYHQARRADVDVVTYERGFRLNTLFFAVNDQVTEFDISRHFTQVRDVPLTERQEERLQRYESARRVGEQAIVQYFLKIDEDFDRIAAEHRIDREKHIAVAYPNIVWDTAVFGQERTFESIWAWMEATIRTYADLPDWELVVRIHPAEVRLPAKTMEPMAELIQAHFPDPPANVHVIPPAAAASSYALMEMADRVLVYSSTMGLEAAMAGKRVVTTARTHYAELGFTTDPRTGEEYVEYLRSALEPVDEQLRRQARRYANLFFYRFHVPVKAVDEQSLGRPHFSFETLEELLSGSYPEVEYLRHGLFPLENGCRILPRAVDDGEGVPGRG